MYCKLCGKHLYESLSFQVLFKWNYQIHIDCEQKRRVATDFITVPIENGLVHYDYLFAEGSANADELFLFQEYMGNWFEKVLVTNEWSMIILLDELHDMNDLQLIVPLGGESVILFSLFDSILVNNEEEDNIV